MKIRISSVISIIMITALVACGPAPTPTMNSADVANTAVALAWTGVAMTQAALPTATATFTPLPTDTPFPTSTPIPPPTVAVVNPAAAPTLDPCQDVPPVKPKGQTVQVKFVNKSEGAVNLSFGMNPANSYGECGIYSFSLGRYDAPVVTVLAGCYWAYAWVTGNKPSTASNVSPLCVTDSGQVRSITIGTERIEFD